jgi:NAD(P)-dependent dehydrogenase (short-subunit alcohol dehydrogenase family)
MKRFEGKVGFVTGGGTGIGLACARTIVEGGGRVMLAGRREEVVRKAAAELGSDAAFVCCDVTDDESVNAAVTATVERFGALHLAVNSAGTGSAGSVLNSTSEDFTRVLDTNLIGAFRSVRAEARAMRTGGGGSIVNISSIAATHTHRWMTAYCASKAGLNMLTRCAADDLGEHGIRVNAVSPSLVPTDIWGGAADTDELQREYLRLMPVSRVGTTEDVSQLTAFLLSDEAGWITGQCIAVDGGHSIRQGPDLVPLFSKGLPVER